jgi:hypothetical protein
VAQKDDGSNEKSEGERKSSGQKGDSGQSSLSGAQLAQHARRELAEITGLEAESVTSLKRADDGSWTVRVELLELSRVPNTDDMLGSYEADLDENGELLGYRRIRRYSRSQSDGREQASADG